MTLSRLGRYDITATLGRGAMGVVYRAHDPLIERIVAIKTVACAGLPEKEAEEFEQRFFREAKSAGKLNHPNIVTIHDIGREGDLAWIAMEFLDGRSLRDILDSGAGLSCERAIEIAAAIADALAFAHASGIVHRDVKPANIMVLANGSVKITDFGIAQLPGGSLTMAGSVLGSPKYMSPEQVTGHKADGRSDIFALGTVLYEMLTGQPPFSGDNLHATMYQVVHKMPPAPSGCCAGLPPAVDAIVARAMAKDPAARYQDAAEMAGELRRVLDTTAATLPGTAPATAPRTAPPDPAKPRSSLLRGVFIGGAVALVATAAFLLLRPAAVTAPVPQADSERPAAVNTPPSTTVADSPVKAPAAAPPAPAGGSPKSNAAGKTTAPGNWQAALQSALKACEAESVFSRVVCIEKARWKHCPGHWGEIADCPSASSEKR
jgi:serine/threonine-protein kinase